MVTDQQRRYSLGEEIANSMTHGLGALFGVVALVILVVNAVKLSDSVRVVSFAVYGGSLILLFSASALYHGVQNPSVKQKLRIFDHSAIFVLIAGTYTPFCLISLKGGWGWTLFGLQWGCAVIGITLTILQIERFKKIEVAMYIAMGWMIVIAIRPLINNLQPGIAFWMIGGGLAYTGGVVFYKWKTLFFNHAIWHLFVLTGSLLHFFGILFYVLPANGL